MAINQIKIMFLLFFLYSNAISQTLEYKKIPYKSLEGKNQLLTIKFDDVNEKMNLLLGNKDSFCIHGYRDLLENIKVFNNRFIVIQYKTKGGSGIKTGNTVIVCSSKNKLYKSMNIISLNNYEFNNSYSAEVESSDSLIEQGLFKIDLNSITSDKKYKYKLMATQFIEVKSKIDSTKNKKTIDTITLFFDEKNKVFFNNYKTLIGDYIFNEHSKAKQYNGEKFPAIILSNENYLHVRNNWYFEYKKNHLIKME